MHHALEIQEILADIFRHLDALRDLSSLARTCWAFKEPALDALWKTLGSLSPLAWCVPEASQQNSQGKYLFHSQLTGTEWDALRRYTHRIRSIRTHDERSFSFLLNSTTPEPLFPNLRSLECTFHVAVHLRLPIPSLLSVDFTTDETHINISALNNSFQSFSQLCPNVRRARFRVYRDSDTIPSENAVSDCIRGWQHLEEVVSDSEYSLRLNFPLGAVAIWNLSRIGCLTRLSFAPDASLLQFDSPLVFPSLHELTLRPKSWGFVSQFLSHVRLPTIAHLHANVTKQPSPPELSSFFANVQMSGASSTISALRVEHSLSDPVHSFPILGLDDLRPCMAFNNLRYIRIDIPWNVGLTDGDLLTLTSAWPCLEGFQINEGWGWGTSDGITLHGLLQLLQTCPSLNKMGLTIDARGYRGPVPSHETLGPTLPRPFFLNVVDSIIDKDAISPVATFLALIALPGFDLYPWAIGRWTTQVATGTHAHLWCRVRDLARDMISQRC